MAENKTKGVIYYTDNVPKESFLKIIRDRLKKSARDIPIVWVSQKPIQEDNNIVMFLNRSHESRTRQILEGLRQIEVDIVFFAEHDVIYHPSHFEFTPPKENMFYYNTNRWWLREEDGSVVCSHNSAALSQLVAYRKLLLQWYNRRVAYYAAGIKTDCGNEPGKHKSSLFLENGMNTFSSEWPNVDIRHKYNYTKSDKFKRDLKDGIPFWGKTKGRYEEFIKEINNVNA